MIVAVKKNGVTCIGGDVSVGASDIHPEHLQGVEKILPVGDSYLGIEPTPNAYWALKRYFQEKKDPICFASVGEIFREFLFLHQALKNDYDFSLSSFRKEPFERLNFQTLLINRYGIFLISQFHCVFEYTKFYAIGEGSDYALGALEARYNQRGSAEDLVRIGLEVAANFMIKAGPPGKIYTVKPCTKLENVHCNVSLSKDGSLSMKAIDEELSSHYSVSA
jgi:ATP-dependent HslUV protease, peptidase subunit HslV